MRCSILVMPASSPVLVARLPVSVLISGLELLAKLFVQIADVAAERLRRVVDAGHALEVACDGVEHAAGQRHALPNHVVVLLYLRLQLLRGVQLRIHRFGVLVHLLIERRAVRAVDGVSRGRCQVETYTKACACHCQS